MRAILILTAAAALTACETAREPVGGAPMPLINSAGQRSALSSPGKPPAASASGLARRACRMASTASMSTRRPLRPARLRERRDRTGTRRPQARHEQPERAPMPATCPTSTSPPMACSVRPYAARCEHGQLLDADGSSLVIHAAADDYVTDPSGNSGARIACAVIRPTPELR